MAPCAAAAGLVKQIGCVINKRHKLTPTSGPRTGRHSTALVDCTRSLRRRIAFGCVHVEGFKLDCNVIVYELM